MGSGPPVLFLHGQPGLGSDWDGVSNLLAADHRVLAPDRPGYGATPGPPVGLGGNAAAAARLLADRRAAPATVVGYSYGAAVALRLAQLHPDDVSGLVLVCPAAGPRALGWADRVLALPGAGEVLAFAGMRGAGQLAGWIRHRTRGLRWPGPVLAAAALDLTPDRIGSYALQWRSARAWRTFAYEQRSLLAEMPTLVADYGLVRAPVTLIAGRRDHVVPPAAVAELGRALGAEATVWADRCGHLLPFQEPELVAGVVATVARRTGPGSGGPPGGRRPGGRG